MSIFDIGKIESDMEDYVERISPKIQEFKKYFLEESISAVIIALQEDFSLREFHQRDLPDDKYIVYFDLARVKEGDYKLIFRKLCWEEIDGVLFDNIDKIPDIEDKEEIEYLVKTALKKDYLPTDKGMPKETLDFGKMMVGARCSDFPDYLKGQSLQTIIISLRD